MQIINIQESDYIFLVTVGSELKENLELKDIPCNALLPKEITGEITLQLFFTKEQYKQSGLDKVWHLSVSGERTEEWLTYQKIIAQRIFHSAEQIHDDLFVLTGEPKTLYIENHHSDSSVTINDESFRTNVEFQLTPSKILEPFRSISEKDKCLWQATIKLCDGNTIVFDDIKHTFRDGKAGWTTKKSLVARCETLKNGSQEDVHRVSDLLDDVLLLTSFAEGQRCSSLGWNIDAKQMQSYYFRRDKSFPDPLKDFWLNKIIEPYETFDAFLQTAYEKFCSSEFKPNIRRAINSIFKRNETFESEFMSLYAGLESLVLGFRKAQGLEYIFSKDNGKKDKKSWEEFKTQLEQWIKEESPLRFDTEQELTQQEKIAKRKDLLLKNLLALERTSFDFAFSEMLKFYEIENELDDLWNIINKGDGWSFLQ